MIEEVQTEDLATSNNFTIEDLRTMAKNAVKEKVETEAAEELDPVSVDTAVARVVQCMKTAAQEGQMEFEYKFEDSPLELMQAVSGEVRAMYPSGLMLIQDRGRNTLIINWSGKNEV